MAITNIDGVPFIWDEQEDKNLLGSLFPDGITSPTFNTIIQGQNSINATRFSSASPLTNYRFSKRLGDEIKGLFFLNARPESKGNTTIYTDVGCSCPDDVYRTFLDFGYDDNQSGEYGDSKEDTYAFTINVFISKHKDKLEECFNCLVPGDTDIFLFLEDNTGDISGVYRSIKIGDLVRSAIRSYDSFPNRKNIDYINEKLPENSKLKDSEVQELFEKGFIENSYLNMVSAFSFFSNLTSPLQAKLYKSIADVIEKKTDYMGMHFKFKRYHWDPNAQKTKIEKVKDKNGKETDKEHDVEDKDPNYKFQPFLFSFITERLDKLDDKNVNTYIAKGFENLRNNFNVIDQAIIQSFQNDLGVISKSKHIEIDIIPDMFEEMLLNKYLEARNIIFHALDELQKLDLTEILKKDINILNAFLCGVWNGLIEAVIGLISMLQMIFRALQKYNELRANLKEELPNMLEQFDSFIQAIRDIKWSDIFNALKDGLKILVSSIFQPELVAYFIGAIGGTILGLVVEIVIGIIFTGGTLSVEAVLQKLTEIFVSMSKTAGSIAKTAKKIAIKSKEALQYGIKQLIQFLRQGTEKIVQLIKDLFEWLKNGYQKVKSIAGLALDPETKIVFERLGIGVRLYDKTSGMMLSTISPFGVIQGKLGILYYKGVKIFQGSVDEMKLLRRKLQKLSPKEQEKYLEKMLLRARNKERLLEDFVALREKFKTMEIGALWKQFVKEPGISFSDLKTLYKKRLHKFPGLQNFHNQAQYRTTIKNLGKKVETVEEYFISGRKETLINNFGSPPKFPKDLTDVLDDYDSYLKFAKGAIDTENRSRKFDSELKFIFNFIKNHMHKGDEFVVEISSLIKVCDSCSRELMMLQELLAQQGKTIKFVVKHDKEIDGFRELLKRIK